MSASQIGLNPYCSGRWSRTRPYKTLLIINKLKNFTKQIFTFLNRKLTFLQRVLRYDYFSKYASQLFLNIQPFLSQKFNSVNQIGRQKPKDKRQDHPPNHYSALTNIRKRRLSPTINLAYPSLPTIKDSNNDKKSDKRIIHIPYKRCKNQPLTNKILENRASEIQIQKTDLSLHPEIQTINIWRSY